MFTQTFVVVPRLLSVALLVLAAAASARQPQGKPSVSSDAVSQQTLDAVQDSAYDQYWRWHRESWSPLAREEATPLTPRNGNVTAATGCERLTNARAWHSTYKAQGTMSYSTEPRAQQ
jgi:hypothetical protein